jgi:hypothetical protein
MPEYKIPDDFLIVISKMNPEISNVEIKNIDTIKTICSTTFNVDELIRINVNLHINREYQLKGNQSTYTETLNNLFRLTYSKHDFISFNVVKFSYLNEKTNMEKFQELFSAN